VVQEAYFRGSRPGRSTNWLNHGHERHLDGRLCEEIDQRVKAFLDRPIEGDWPYLWIATYVKVRQAGRIVSVARHCRRWRQCRA
jgi:putative transposase